MVDSCLTTGPQPKQTEADHEFGPTLEIWEGYAADPEIRFRASSGGLLTALSLYCLENENMGFVLHTGMDEKRPWTNRTVQSRDKQELLSRTGSRYAPASPCDGLAAIEQSDTPCVFIGKPCDTAGVALACRERPELEKKIGLVLTFFCAGTPSTRGTLDLVKSIVASPDEITALQYRGEGWPGRFKVQVNGKEVDKSYSYDESWGRLTSYRPMRCHLCPDGLGRVSDIACGDAWEQFEGGNDPGRSIALVRTPRGQQILHAAMAAGYVELRPVDSAAVMAAQVNLLGKRRELFGRLLARRLLLIPTPKFLGFSLFRSWIRLPAFEKSRSVLGSLVRLVERGLWRRHRVS